MNTTIPNSSRLQYTPNTELEGNFDVIEGSLPADLTGVFYVIYPVGSVNSDGLPIPEKLKDGSDNPEYGSPVMNGNGMVLKVDFNQGPTPAFKTRLMKPVCYYADLASSTLPDDHGYKFKNYGITRMSIMLGARNLLNTALIPFRFENQATTAMVATYDVGRPYVVDPDSLELVTPVGKIMEWLNAEPKEVPWPFGVRQTTAHPSFDPVTREFFTVNYKKESDFFMTLHRMAYRLEDHKNDLIEYLEKLATQPLNTLERIVSKVSDFFGEVKDFFLHDEDRMSLEKFLSRADEKESDIYLNLVRWKDKEPLEKWAIVDEDDQPIQIHECMHQIGITRDYIILTDCSFKFTLDLMANNPFPNNAKIDEFLRWMFSKPMEPNTVTYIIKRADLQKQFANDELKTIKATKLKKPIPLETIHYSLDYDNPDGKCTLYGIHNAATCVAEWLRPYDKNYLTGEPISEDLVGLFALGAMDVSRLGKWVINAETGEWLEKESNVIALPGDLDNADVGPHTWEIVLYTYRDILSSETVVNKIKYMWFISAGVRGDMLSDFIFDLYKDYPNRGLYPKNPIDSVDKVLEYTRKGIPFTLNRINCETMEVDQHFQMADQCSIRGVHFAQRATPTPGVDPQLDGYLICPVVYTKPNGEGRSCEIWIFDAGNINVDKPVCRLHNKDLHFFFTLHTLWLPEASPCKDVDLIDIEEDFNSLICELPDHEGIYNFFNEYVYPHYKKAQ